MNPFRTSVDCSGFREHVTLDGVPRAEAAIRMVDDRCGHVVEVRV